MTAVNLSQNVALHWLRWVDHSPFTFTLIHRNNKMKKPPALWSRPHFVDIEKTPKLETGVGSLPASVCLIYAVVVFGCKNVCISQFVFVPLPDFVYHKDRVLPF